MGSSMSVQFQKWSSTWIHKLLSTFINGIGKERVEKKYRVRKKEEMREQEEREKENKSPGWKEKKRINQIGKEKVRLSVNGKSKGKYVDNHFFLIWKVPNRLLPLDSWLIKKHNVLENPQALQPGHTGLNKLVLSFTSCGILSILLHLTKIHLLSCLCE